MLKVRSHVLFLDNLKGLISCDTLSQELPAIQIHPTPISCNLGTNAVIATLLSQAHLSRPRFRCMPLSKNGRMTHPTSGQPKPRYHDTMVGHYNKLCFDYNGSAHPYRWQHWYYKIWDPAAACGENQSIWRAQPIKAITISCVQQTEKEKIQLSTWSTHPIFP